MSSNGRIIETRNVRMSFGARTVLRGVSFSLAPGGILGIIGPNGAGKTTLLNILTGFYPPRSGKILIDGTSIAGASPDRIARLGVMRTFQQTRVFSGLTVMENMLLSTSTAGLGKKEAADRCREMLHLLELEPIAGCRGEEISGGQAKLLEIGCCLAARPRVLLLDEPFAAVHPRIKAVLSAAIRKTNAKGQAYLIVSHDIPALAGVCSQALIMNAGKVVAQSALDSIVTDRAFIDTYLGGLPA